MAAHYYQQSGRYTPTLTATSPDGSYLQVQHVITVSAGPPVDLGARQVSLCTGQQIMLSNLSPTPAGTTYRWQDGSSNPTFTASQPGKYVLVATYAQGCRARDSVTVQLNPRPMVSLGPDTALCDNATPILLRANPQPVGSTYRWQDGTTAATYPASAVGTYYLDVRNAAGCTTRDSIAVKAGTCPVFIPNIITPNDDRLNQTFSLQGLTAANWAIRIFSRWGREVFQQASYDNAWTAAGQANGVYYYLLTNAKTGQQYKGWVEVRR